MIVTTTASIEGYRVVRHLGPVSVHMVAGTNLFSDFFASVTDIFGGMSGSYGRQLSNLYTRATKLLEEEARKRGANAVLGLSIDFDELSAQGKSMFMLNAVGTAVRVVEISRELSGSPEGVPADAVSRALRKRAFVRELAAGRVPAGDDLWEFAISERIEAFTRYVVGAVAGAEGSPGGRYEELERARPFFMALGPELSSQRLFPYLSMTNKVPANARNAATDLIRVLDLMDYRLLLELLDAPEVETARRGLQIATALRQDYCRSDVDSIRQVRERVATRFVKRWTPTKVKGMFGKEHSAWVCPCGGTPGAEDTYCPTCNRDIRGLAARDMTPEQVTEHLDELLTVLTGSTVPDVTQEL